MANLTSTTIQRPDTLCTVCGLHYQAANGHTCPARVSASRLPVAGPTVAGLVKQVQMTEAKLAEVVKERDEWKAQAKINADAMAATANAVTPLVDRAFRFIGGLQLGDQPIAVQKEQRQLVHELVNALRPASVKHDIRGARMWSFSSAKIESVTVNGQHFPAGIVKSITYSE